MKLQIPELEVPDILPEEIPLDILCKDTDLLVVNKPKGMVVHPAPGHYTGTPGQCFDVSLRENLSGINGACDASRDRTSGSIWIRRSLLVCKNDRAHQILAEQLKDHSITRRYEAIVHGKLKEGGYRHGQCTVGRHPTDRKKMSVHAPHGRER